MRIVLPAMQGKEKEKGLTIQGFIRETKNQREMCSAAGSRVFPRPILRDMRTEVTRFRPSTTTAAAIRKTVFPGRVTSRSRTGGGKGNSPWSCFFFRDIHGVITALFVFLGAHGGRVTQ